MNNPKILHLSDVHYGDDVIPWAVLHGRGFTRRPSDALKVSLQTTIKELKPDYVVISGDFVNKAQKKCFKEAAQYIRDLLTNAEIPIQTRVFVVPGNHDVPFLGTIPDDTKRLKQYRKFVQLLYQDINPEQRLLKFVEVSHADHLVFLAVDTTLKSLAPRAEGEIGINQLTWAKQELDELKRELGARYYRYAKVAILHHHLVPVPGTSVAKNRDMQLLDDGKMMALLKSFEFDLVLHGHKHVPHMSKEQREDGGYLTVVGAGTAMAPYPDQQGPYGNNFNLIEIRHDRLQLLVSRFKSQEDDTFALEFDPKAFPLGKRDPAGLKTRKLHRISRIAANGDTIVKVHREGILVLDDNRVKKLPVRFSTDTAGAEICDVKLNQSDSTKLSWEIENKNIYDGFVVFDKERILQDGEISVLYEYKIKSGTVMSLRERDARLPGSAIPFEELQLSLASEVDELEVELEFPPRYTADVKVIFERYGVDLGDEIFRGKYSLTRNEIVNGWRFRMEFPPKAHGIRLRWNLPIDWSSGT